MRGRNGKDYFAVVLTGSSGRNIPGIARPNGGEGLPGLAMNTFNIILSIL
jgi:hypothetical protein